MKNRLPRFNASTLFPTLVLSFLVLALALPLCVAQTNEEQLIQILQSSCGPAEKDAACAQLKRSGTARSVPALVALLTDEQLSHSARYALESMPVPEAERALLDALDKTTGLTKVGIVQSLGARGETRAVPALKKLLAPSDIPVACAAARALGQIGNADALKALQAALKQTTGPLHAAVADGILRCADRLLATGSQSKARSAFERLYTRETQDHLRMAAYRGLLRASGPDALFRMTQAIPGKEPLSQMAALQFVHEVQAPEATIALAQLLLKLDPALQVALIEGLAQRNDPAAAPALLSLADSQVPEVRLAVIKALGMVGTSSAVPILAGFAASGAGPEQSAARQALMDLRRGRVTETMVAQLANSRPAVQAELARALGQRGDRSALATLVNLAQQGSDSARQGALLALAQLVQDSQLGFLVQIVVDAKSDAARTEAAGALNAAYQRLLLKRGPINSEPLVKGLKVGSPEARVALLPVCSGLAAREVRVALRAALQDPEPRVRAAALGALCDSCDADLLSDLVEVVRATSDVKVRNQAIGGCVRLSNQEAARLSNSQRVQAFRGLLGLSLRPEQKRLVLAGIGEIADEQALKLAESLLEETAVQTEAAQAMVKVAALLPPEQAELAAASMQKVLGATNHELTRQAAETTLKQIEANADFITVWQVAGPYRQENKDYAALFEIPFAPELPDSQGVKWQILPGGSDPKRPWLMDLFKAFGGQQCVAYARTWVRCDQPQPALLEIGSDDGVKVWLNEKQVHANNAARPLQPGSDKINVQLNKGWNVLVLKVTQNNQGWEFCARLRKPDGTHMAGLQFDTSNNSVNQQ